MIMCLYIIGMKRLVLFECTLWACVCVCVYFELIDIAEMNYIVTLCLNVSMFVVLQQQWPL